MEHSESLDYKQVLIVRKDLNMRKGKIGAQCAHASWLGYLNDPEARTMSDSSGKKFLLLPMEAPDESWFTSRFKKITVSVNSEAELLALYETAKARGIRCGLVRDSGLTEFKGVPTYTVLALGPNTNEVLDPLTGKLPLL